MSATAFSVTIDGYPATEIASHTAPTWETLADGGCGEATWEFAITPKTRHHALRPTKSLVVVRCGTHPVFTGLLTEADRSTGECHAFGLWSSLDNYLALDSGGAATRDIGVAVSQAIARGWRGTNPFGVGGVVAGDGSGPISVARLIAEYAEQTGQRAGCDAAGRLYLSPDPTTHQWLTSPDSAAFGVTDEDTPTRLAGRYDTGAGNATVMFGEDGKEQDVDLTDRGPMTMMAAEVILAGMLIRRGEIAWTNGVTLTSGQLTNAGGVPAFLPAVRALSAVKLLGIGHALPSGPLRHAVIGKTRHTAGEPTIYVEPVNTAPRTAVDVWSA